MENRLEAGRRLGPYEIVSRLGAGGMGEVWRARDTRLERHVAIKVLPAELAQNAQLKLRFEREAKAISQLSHPHICALYDVGDGYLVMELLEGETLAARLERGPLPVADVVRYGTQIAGALDRAHRAGLVHRDLKPGNVMLTRSGAKLLDFGLARAVPFGIAPDATTRREPLTEDGTILGTLPYMSPEQVEGQHVDHRTDIFSLGAVLYEMATGTRAFQAASRASLIVAIMSGEPRAMTGIVPLTPPPLERLIRICLAKDPDERWQSAHDVRLELQMIEAAAADAQPAARPARRRWIAVAALVLLAAGIGAGAVAAWRLRPKASPAITRFPLYLGPGLQIPAGQAPLAISPDGQVFAYCAATGVATGPSVLTRLYLRRADRLDAVTVAGSEGAYDPFFSADGTAVAFFTPGRLKSVPIDGGPTTEIAGGAIGNARGGTWAADGTIYLAPFHSEGISKISAAGGTLSVVTTPDPARGENSHRWPQVLPGSRHLLFTVRTDRISSFDEASLAVLSLDTGKWTTVLKNATFGRFVAPGSLFFARGGAIYAAAFDLERMKVTGPALKVADGALQWSYSGAGTFAVSGRGTLAYVPGDEEAFASTLIRVDEQGQARPVVERRRRYQRPRISPDGRRIVTTILAANDDVWIYDTARNALARAAALPGDESTAIWSRDGRSVYFDSANRTSRIMSLDLERSGEPREVFSSSSYGVLPASWSARDELICVMTSRKAAPDIMLLKDGRLQPLVQTERPEFEPQASPDGRWLAYNVAGDEGREIYVQSLLDGRRWQVSLDGGSAPHWAPAGNRLFFSSDDRMFAIDVKNEASFANAQPRLLFEKRYFGCGFDVFPDGKSFLMCDSPTATGVDHVNVILDWRPILEKQKNGEP